MKSPRALSALELKVPPVIVVLGTAVLIWLGPRLAPGLNLEVPFRRSIAWSLAVTGLITCTLGFVRFKRAGTTVNPTKPESSSSLVTAGIYQRTRNPMYLGFLLILTGWAAAKANLGGFLMLPAFALYLNEFQIKPEERALLAIFGPEFQAYCSRVRRWI